MRGTRIRWDGALKALGIGVAALVAVVALPGLLAGEPPPPPADVGLVTTPPPAPRAPARAPAPVPVKPAKSAKPKRDAERRRKDGDDERQRGKGRRGARRERGAANADVPEAPAAPMPTYIPPPATKENFDFER